LAPIAVDASGDQPHLADGELALDIGALRMEEDQLDFAAFVLADDPVGGAAVARRRRKMLLDPDEQRDDFALLRLGDGWMRAAVGKAGGEMPEQVDEARIAGCRLKKLAQQLLIAWADAFERLDSGKKRIEQSWPGASFCGKRVRIRIVLIRLH